MKIDAAGLDHRELNKRIRAAIESGSDIIQLDHINGQRYIGAGLRSRAKIIINGVPGNDLAAFMDGCELVVNANAQDAAGNTMNSGKIVIHGDARDLIGYSMRGGKIFISGSVGYRVGIHMKSFKEQVPVLVIGGKAKDFLGEYMAGGIVALLGLDLAQASAPQAKASAGAHRVSVHETSGQRAGTTAIGVSSIPRPVVRDAIAGHSVGTGMHGGCIYVRGTIPEENLGKEAKSLPLTDQDKEVLDPILREFAASFGLKLDDLLRAGGAEPYESFTKLLPLTLRPYGRMYAY